MKSRHIKNNFFKYISYLAVFTVLLTLVSILGTITIKAIPSMSWYFFTTSEADHPGFGGAIGNAVAGTLILATLSPLLASPIAIGTAVYMRKYATKSRLTRSFSFLIDVLSGTPSIVLGIFGLLVLVFYLKGITGGFSMISGVIALAILILPVIERSTEEAIAAVPAELEEASYALGATKWETTRLITIPSAINGIVTGIVLSVGRAAEESAVVILTAGYSQFYPEFKVVPSDKLIYGFKIYPLNDLVAALPITVYHSFEFPHLMPISQGFAAAFILILIVMLINAVTRIIVWRNRIG